MIAQVTPDRQVGAVDTETRWKTVLANAPIVLFAMDLNGILTLCEGKGSAELWFQPEDIVDQSAYDVFKDVPEVSNCITRSLSGEEFQETVGIGPLWYECHYSPLFECGEFVGVIGTALDVTAHRKVELELERKNRQLSLNQEALRSKQAKLRAATTNLRHMNRVAEQTARRFSDLFQGLPAACCAFDSAGRIMEWNRAFEALVERSAPEILGVDLCDLVTSLHSATSLRVMMDRIMAGEVQEGVEARVVRPDKSERYVLRNVFPQYDHNGGVIGGICAAIDITDRHTAAMYMETAKDLAEAANSAKSEFLSRMSHELRTPMNAVLGFGQLLEMGLTSEDDLASVDQILKAGRHLLSLIDEVLDISRIEAGKLAVSLEAVRAGDVVDEVVTLMGPIATQAGIQLTVRVDTLWNEHIRVDRQRIKQVLMNLLSNAIKYNVPHGSVTLTCSVPVDGRYRISVTDTGRGIAPSRFDRLFNPFDRLGADQLGIEGTGLGLALSKRLVETMDGVIIVDSEEGRGSTFSVEFAVDEHPISQSGLLLTDNQEHDPIVRPNKTILYIEDNQPNIDLVEAILRRRPEIKLITAMLGSLGIELAREHRPDLVLLDMNLPDTTGLKVLQTFKDDPTFTDFPVVVLTADVTPSRIIETLTAGASAYLSKPLSVEQFLHTIDEALSKNQE